MFRKAKEKIKIVLSDQEEQERAREQISQIYGRFESLKVGFST
jgi:hypothetical protein